MKPIETIQQAKLYVKHIPNSAYSLESPWRLDLLIIFDFVEAIKSLEERNIPIPDYLQKAIIHEINKHIESSNFHPEKACPCNLCLKEKQLSTPIEALSSIAYYMELLLDLLEIYDKNSHSGLAQEAKLMLKEVTEKFLTEQNPPGD